MGYLFKFHNISSNSIQIQRDALHWLKYFTISYSYFIDSDMLSKLIVSGDIFINHYIWWQNASLRDSPSHL